MRHHYSNWEEKWAWVDKAYAAKTNEEKREILRQVEEELKELIGKGIEHFGITYEKMENEERGKLDALICVRKHILNDMFRPTSAEVERLCRLNDLLHHLDKEMRRRTAELYRFLLRMGKDAAFDDDYEVEGELCYSFNDGQSILKLEDDAYYGSDFTYMIDLVDAYVYETSYHYIEQCHISYNPRHTPEVTDEELDIRNPLDDGTSWAEGVLRIPQLESVCICYPLHDLFSHKPYSVPDILRMNDFWTEAHLHCQHIVSQDGTRYCPPYGKEASEDARQPLQ